MALPLVLGIDGLLLLIAFDDQICFLFAEFLQLFFRSLQFVEPNELVIVVLEGLFAVGERPCLCIDPAIEAGDNLIQFINGGFLLCKGQIQVVRSRHQQVHLLHLLGCFLLCFGLNLD